MANNAKISGTTERFKGDGRKLGYPTANISTDTKLKDGVYCGYASLGKFRHQPALIFIGVPETMGETVRRVEAYILDIPDEDYYGQQLKLELTDYLRSNHKFPSVDELKAQMAEDVRRRREILTTKHKNYKI